MSKKIVKYTSSLFNQEVKLTLHEKSSGIDLKKVAPEKLAKANEALKGAKLPR